LKLRKSGSLGAEDEITKKDLNHTAPTEILQHSLTYAEPFSTRTAFLSKQMFLCHLINPYSFPSAKRLPDLKTGSNRHPTASQKILITSALRQRI
jgi:hypothetical protein